MQNDDFKPEPLTEEQTQQIVDLIAQVVMRMGIESSVSVEENLTGKNFNISSPDSNLLIGQHGANLHALQSLIHVIAYKKFGVVQRFVLDVDDYKKKREWYLRETAKKALEQVRKNNRSVALEPMPAYERRIIHAYLSEEIDIETESMGLEPQRKLVIKLKHKGEI